MIQLNPYTLDLDRVGFRCMPQPPSGGKGDSTSTDALAFDPEPSKFRETGDSTGIFQVVIEVPETIRF